MEFDVRLLAPIATSIGIGISIILWTLNQRRKALSYQILKCESLISLKGDAKKHLTVSFNGQRMEDAKLLLIKISNSGHLPITPADYQARLSIDLGSASTILTANITATSPANIDDRARAEDGTIALIEKVEKNKATLRPVLLNDGDSITVQLLVKHLSGRVRIGGHIQGIRGFKEENPRSILPFILTQLGAWIMALSMIGMDPEDFASFHIESMLPCLLAFLLGYVFLSAGSYLPVSLKSAQEAD